MKKRTYIMRLLSAGMCIVMVLALLGGCAAPAESPDDGHDHDDVTILDDENVPMFGTAQVGCNHSSTTKKVEIVYNDCDYGKCERTTETCTSCGASWTLITRDLKEDDGKAWTKKAHTMESTTINSDCPSNPATQEICSTCHYANYPNAGGHVWGAETASEGNPCTEEITYTKTCTKCNETSTRIQSPIGHSWRIDSEKQPTCEEPGEITKTCNRCHTTVTETGKPALGHQYKQTETDCTSVKECQRCHKTIPGGQHTYSNAYVQDGSKGHYRVCNVCRIKGPLEAHVDQGDGYCACGYQMVANAKPGVCIHNYVFLPRDSENAAHTGRCGALSHWVICTKCGDTTTVTCANVNDISGRTDCTQDVICECGNVAIPGNSKHYMSAWETTADGHERKCTSKNCTYTEKGNHQYNATSTDCTAARKCTICSYAQGTAAYSTHAWSSWTDNGGGAHTRRCTHPGCQVTESAAHVVSGNVDDCTKNLTCSVCSAVVVAGSSQHIWGAPTSAGEGGHNRHCLHPGCSAVQNSAHTGGTATCTSAAQCTECGGYYGSKNPNNHSGGTEIRNAVPATVGKAGYTGDTYCVGCGQKIASGQTIEALKEDHSHAYGAQWVSDDTGHWHVCTCGEKGSFAVHDYKDGKCSVCEAADPNYVEHVHTYTETWSADSHNHWHVCTGCGEKADVTEHVIVTTDDGSTHCLTCGMTLEDYKAKVEEETGKAPGTQPEDQPGETEPGTEPGGTQSPEQPPVEEHPSEQFKDVSANETEVAAIDFVVGSGLMAGTDTVNGKFTPYGTTTRGQVMTILAKMSGVDTYDPDDWQRKGIEWATSNGLTEDTDGNAAMKRSELIYMLWKATGSQAADLSVLDAYSDAGQLTGEYRQAMAWAVQYLGMRGNGSELMLDATTTRVQLAIILNSADSKGLLG